MAVSRRAAAGLGLTAAVTLLAPTGCAPKSTETVNYAVDGVLSTYNTNTVNGAASAGPQALARVLTGFSFHGPDGQILPDHDFGTVTSVGGEPLTLDYQINDTAVYSDGKPVTCDDMVLAWAAQSGRFPGFDAASQAGYIDVAGIECQPGEKKAKVTFLPGRAVVDQSQLFTATSMMPAHVIADELGIDVTGSLLSRNPEAVGRIADTWNKIWDLKPDLDLKRFPSSGPYKIESVTDAGAVVLVENDKWWGAKPVTKRITVWPHGIDVQDRVNNGTFHVVDVATGSSGTLTTPDNYQRTEIASGGIEQLIFGARGPVSTVPARKALAQCTPRDIIAQNAQMPIANVRLNTATDDAYSPLESGPLSDQYNVANPDVSRMLLEGQPLTVRIGYQSPNPRLAATIAAITKACAAAGITIEDVTSDSTGPQALRDGKIDALLASTGGAAGSGSTGSSNMDDYTLHTGNGNNLSAFSNPEIDGIVSSLIITADPKERVRLLGDAAPILWNEMPSLPLYRQQRTLLWTKRLFGVQANPTKWGAGWNMDRWSLEP